MGGTGALSFCGNNNFQLIISKRCPDIQEKDDATHDLWGFTIVRRERPLPGTGLRSSKFTYLVGSDQSVLSFASDLMPIIPTSGGGYDDMEGRQQHRRKGARQFYNRRSKGRRSRLCV